MGTADRNGLLYTAKKVTLNCLLDLRHSIVLLT